MSISSYLDNINKHFKSGLATEHTYRGDLADLINIIVSEVDVMLVVGAQNSSNSNRLREIGGELGVPSYLIDDANSLDLEWLAKAQTIGVSAGASAPEELLDELIEKLRQNFYIKVRKFEGVEENVQFKLPPEITEAKSESGYLKGGG